MLSLTHLLLRKKQNVRSNAIALCMAVLSIAAFTAASDISIYSVEQAYIGPRAVINTGYVQSESSVLVDNYAQIKGSVYSSGTALVRSYSHVYEDLYTGGTYTVEPGATVDGDKREDVEVPAYTLETKNVAVGYCNVYVGRYQTKTLSPGAYKDVFIGQGGKLYLSAGIYNFRQFEAYYGSKVYVDIAGSEEIEINVRDNFVVRDRAKMYFHNAENPSAVHIYTNQSSWVDIGGYADYSGVLSAPNAEIRLLSRGNWTGELNGKKVSVMAEASINGLMAKDSDEDGVPDVVEYEATTNPFDASSKPATLVEGFWENRTAWGEQVQVYNFSHFSGYERVDEIPVFIPAQNLTGPYSILYTYKDGAGSGIPDDDYTP